MSLKLGLKTKDRFRRGSNMPCRTEICTRCNEYDCPGAFGDKCIYPDGKTKKTIIPTPIPFDTAGALCDVLSLLEDKWGSVLATVDKETLRWWRQHEKNEQEKIKKEALSKLTPRERRALGLK